MTVPRKLKAPVTVRFVEVELVLVPLVAVNLTKVLSSEVEVATYLGAEW